MPQFWHFVFELPPSFFLGFFTFFGFGAAASTGGVPLMLGNAAARYVSTLEDSRMLNAHARTWPRPGRLVDGTTRTSLDVPLIYLK